MAGGRGGHKEWSYFCVCAPDLDVLINFSLMDRLSGDQYCDIEIPRVTLLTRLKDGEWNGDVEQHQPSDVTVNGGQTDLAIAGNKLHFSGDHYVIDARVARSRIVVALRFEPMIKPAVASSVRLSSSGAMRWLVIRRRVFPLLVVAMPKLRQRTGFSTMTR